MITRIVRFVSLVGVGAFAAWIARLASHGKVPPPEGHWREMRDEELGT